MIPCEADSCKKRASFGTATLCFTVRWFSVVSHQFSVISFQSEKSCSTSQSAWPWSFGTASVCIWIVGDFSEIAV